MALFGRKDPRELLQEGMKVTGLVQDWLKQPLSELKRVSNGDFVMAEHYCLTICSYIAREKISPAARGYLHEAVVRTSTYGKEYAKDLQKEASYLAVLISTLESKEKEARRKRINPLQAIADVAFKDFSSYTDPQTAKRVVYKTLNQFNEEIPTTDYANLRIPVPAAPARSSYSAPSAPARSSYSAPSAPAKSTYTPPARTVSPEPAKPVYSAPAAKPAPRKADYTFVDNTTNRRFDCIAVGRRIIHQNRVYELAIRRDGDFRVLVLDVTERTEEFVRDNGVLGAVLDTFVRQNPELSYLVNTPRPSSDLPTHFNITENGRTVRRRIAIWMEVHGKMFAYCPRNDGPADLIMLLSNNAFADVSKEAMAPIVLKAMKEKYPLLFE